MIDLSSGGLRRGRSSGGRASAGRRGRDTDVNPMESMANIADVMLVFACGLLLALATYWNLDLPSMANLADAREVEDVESAGAAPEDAGEEDAGYDELGVVYQDPETGRMYLVES